MDRLTDRAGNYVVRSSDMAANRYVTALDISTPTTSPAMQTPLRAFSHSTTSRTESSIDERISSSYVERTSHTTSPVAAHQSRAERTIASRLPATLTNRHPSMAPGPYPLSTPFGGDRQAPAARRYASSPLAGNSIARFGDRTPPFSPSSPPFTSPFVHRFPSHSPGSQRRSPAGSAGVGSRRRFSEQSFIGSGAVHSAGSLVGSYEESLLNGRMSTVPSKPLTFDAELGVLGLGQCKSSLKCPPHLNVKFPAHFYNLDNSLADMEGKVSPSSPYVGTIDLESHYIDQLVASGLEEMQIDDDAAASAAGPESHWASTRILETFPMAHEHSNKAARRSMSTKRNMKLTFPGYRVPPKGQVQLVIKNPNLTAVKVFLVPYDLTDMPAGKKTFVRQKCHVSPPATTNAPASPSPSPRASPRPSRDTLRYAVHLQFCAVPSGQAQKKADSKHGFEGDDRLHRTHLTEEAVKKNSREPRYYLHKAIRVVFSARVPDKSEKLTNATETPQDSSGQNVYSTFSGPGEDWKEARRSAKERALVASLERRHATNQMSANRLDGQDTFDHDGLANSDPNGERWLQQTPEEGEIDQMDVETSFDSSFSSAAPMSVQPDAVDIPLHRRTSRLTGERMPIEAQSQVEGTPSVRLPASQASFANAAASFIPHSSRTSQGRSRAPSVDAHAFHFSARPKTPLLDNNGEIVATEDQALLRQWHASLSSRGQNSLQHTARPSSPTSTRSRPTSPPSLNPHATAALGTGSLVIMQRSASNSSVGSSTENGNSFAALAPSSSRSSLRGSTGVRTSQQRTISPFVPPAYNTSSSTLPIAGLTTSTMQPGVPSPRLSEACLEVEPVSGVIMSSSVSSTSTHEGSTSDCRPQAGASHDVERTDVIRPMLLRSLSTQAIASAYVPPPNKVSEGTHALPPQSIFRRHQANSSRNRSASMESE